jgi:7-cyano-7-deazaguanine synthase
MNVEYFDSLKPIQLLNKFETVVFGGAVRDVLINSNLTSDIDIVVDINNEILYDLLISTFGNIIKIDGLNQLLNSTLVEGGSEVPEGHYAEENMKDTVVPNRNKIFSSIIQSVALSIATKGEKKEVFIAMGIHAGDHTIYPDCRQEFRDKDFQAFREGNWDSHLVKIYTPYINIDKFGILQDGKICCDNLGINFNEVYKRTNTSYKPIMFLQRTETGSPYHKWYSDYKSSSSVERIEAFIKLGYPDPVEYADENGPVEWEIAKSHVEKVLNSL